MSSTMSFADQKEDSDTSAVSRTSDNGKLRKGDRGVSKKKDVKEHNLRSRRIKVTPNKPSKVKTKKKTRTIKVKRKLKNSGVVRAHLDKDKVPSTPLKRKGSGRKSSGGKKEKGFGGNSKPSGVRKSLDMDSKVAVGVNQIGSNVIGKSQVTSTNIVIDLRSEGPSSMDIDGKENTMETNNNNNQQIELKDGSSEIDVQDVYKYSMGNSNGNSMSSNNNSSLPSINLSPIPSLGGNLTPNQRRLLEGVESSSSSSSGNNNNNNNNRRNSGPGLNGIVGGVSSNSNGRRQGNGRAGRNSNTNGRGRGRGIGNRNGMGSNRFNGRFRNNNITMMGPYEYGPSMAPFAVNPFNGWDYIFVRVNFGEYLHLRERREREIRRRLRQSSQGGSSNGPRRW